MGALQFARSWYCAEWSGTVSLRVDSDYRHKQESFKPNEMCGSPRSRDTGLFLSYHVVSAEGLRQGRFGRGTSTGGFGRGLRQGHFSWGDSAGVHRQEDLAGCYCRGTSTGMLRQGGALRQGLSERGASAGGLQLFQNIMSFL